MPPSLGGGAIARGSLFHIDGLHFGRGAAVRVAQGDRHVEAVVVEAGPQQILGIMPADAPLGAAQLTVIFEGRASLPYDLKIVRSSFGILKDSVERNSDGTVTLWGRAWDRRSRGAPQLVSDPAK